ncbi:GNAT family N-acetyltransferase [Paenibacillus sp. FSL K6-2862]|uniref:GNAT family N-acetyltransferase n=1 Tax=Paenibacillus sp. FSL K6-2862 TaxID=2921484 RepID=UPI0030FA263E
MTKDRALQISKWQYEYPYSMYNMDSSEDSILELMNEEYYYALDEHDDLIGFICAGESARVPGGYAAGIYTDLRKLDIGLGLKPDLAGNGKGQGFLTEFLSFLNNQFSDREYQLVVAAFNERAIKVYERIGFMKETHFMSKYEEKELEFISMSYIKKNV